MRVLYFAHSLLNRGGDKVVLAHLWHLAESGHRVKIRTNTVDTIFPIHPAIALEKITFPSPVGTILAAIFEKQLSEYVIATIIPIATCLFVRNRRKVIYLAQEYEEHGYSNPLPRLFVRFLSSIGLNWFKIPTIAVSNQLAESLGKRFNTHVEVVTNCIDSSIYFPDPDQELIASKGTKRAILLFARSDLRKGFDRAIKVVEKLRRDNISPFDVWIIGENTGLALPDFPHHNFGFVNDVLMRKILSSADIFLYPPRTEGYGLIVAEAFACKCPVVTTSAVPIAEDEVNALVSMTGSADDLAAKVIRLLEDQELGALLARRGYDFVRGMSLQASSNRFETVLIGLRRIQ
jgi:glycosyltransferase involved in cell wall biosynthesis